MKYIKIILLTFLLAFNLEANEQIGVLSAAVGKVYNQDNKEIKNGDPIFFGDSLISKEGAKAQILLNDQTVLTLGANAELTIDEFVYDPKTNDGNIISTVKKGSVKIISGAISEKKPENLVIKLPAGTIGTRGTEFQATVNDQTTESKILLIGPGPNNSLGLRPGAVQVSNNLGSVVMDSPYLFTKLSTTEAPTPPIPVPPEELNNFKKDIANQPKTDEPTLQTEEAKEVAEKIIYEDEDKRAEILSDVVENETVKEALNASLGTEGKTIDISLIVDNTGILTNQTAINEIGKLADEGKIKITDFYTLVGKDSKGNEIIAVAAKRVSTDTSIAIVSDSSKELTGTYTYDSGTVYLNPVTSNTLLNNTDNDSDNYFRSVTTVNFDKKTLSTVYTGSVEMDIAASPVVKASLGITSTTASFTSTAEQQYNWQVQSSGSSAASILDGKTGLSGTSGFSAADSALAAFGNFNAGTSTLKIEAYDDNKAYNSANIETISGSKSITPTKN